MSASKKPRGTWVSRSLLQGAHLCLCTNETSFRAELRHMRIPTPHPEFVGPTANARTHSFVNAKGALCCVVCIRDFRDKDPVEVAALLVHEAVHVWQQTRVYLGETAPSPEFEAYAIQNISGNLMQAFADTALG